VAGIVISATWRDDRAYCGQPGCPRFLTRLAERPGWVRIGVHWEPDEQAGYLRHLGKHKARTTWYTNISSALNKAMQEKMRSVPAPFEARLPITMLCPKCQTVNEVAGPIAKG
jgi:hypothetical protein